MGKTNENHPASLIPDSEKVPEDLRRVFLEIVALTDEFCKERLNAEYQQMCRDMAVAVCQPGSPVKRGKRESWACGIVYTVGWVNWLGDPNQEPHLRSEEIAEGFGVSMGTMYNKSKEIREGLDLVRSEPYFTLPSRVANNPLVWMAELNGVIVDLRMAPRPIQVAAYEQGLIPYVPGEETQPEQAPRRKQPRRATPKRDLLMQFKITLKGAEPPIWRRIQVYDCTLDKLHEHIQTATGWTNSHLHQFIIEGEYYGDPDLLDDGYGDFQCIDSTKTLVSEIVPESGERFSFKYEYDFGDNWQHEILFEGFPPREKGKKYPACLEGARACPPEDVGGTWGYEDFVAAITDPEHEEHESFLEWGGPFDPEEFDPKEATERMKDGLPDWRRV